MPAPSLHIKSTDSDIMTCS